MIKEILRLYEQDESIRNLYVSISNREIFISQDKKSSHLINIRSMTKSIVSLLIGIALKKELYKVSRILRLITSYLLLLVIYL